MSAEVLLSDTFDQWRMKTNEWLSMTNSAGSSNFIKTNATTNSTSNTTGAITTAGGMGIGSSAVIGGDLTIFGDVDVDGTLNFDASDIDGAWQIDATVTVGVDDTGHDVKFFGATSGQYMLWDQSADELVLPGTQKLSFHDAAGGENILASADGHLEVNAGTTLDITAPTVDINVATLLNIDGTSQFQRSGDNAAFLVGWPDTGHDVTFYGDTSGQYMLWDESADELALVGDTKLSFHDAAGGENIIASADGHLEVNAGTTLDITAPTVDINVATLLNIDGVSQFQRAGDTAAFLVGWNDTGHDVTFYGDTSGQYMLWDESEDELALVGDTKLSFHDAAGGENIVASTNGHLEINAGTTLDITAPTVDINASSAVNVDGPTQLTGTVTVGVDDTGHDVKFFGATASAYMIWDESANDLEFAGVAALSIDCTTDATNTTSGSFHTDGGMGIAKKLYVGTDLDVNGTTNLDAVDIDGAVQIDGAVTVGVDDTGHDVKFFGASAGAFILYDQSEDTLEIRGASADATTSTGKLLLSTSLTDINDGDVIGSIGFKAPLEAGGTDAILIGASIFAEADATFSSSVNSTDLVFATGDSGAATEKMRIDSTGQVTFADGAIDVDIASHDGTNGLKLGGTLVKANATDFNGMIPLGKSVGIAMVFAKTD